MVPDLLETVNTTLRPFTHGDAPAVFTYWLSDPGWERYNASVPSEFSETDAQRFVEDMCARCRTNSPNWAIVYRGAVVGVVSMTFEQAHRIAVIGYGIHGGLRGRGLSIEAVRVVIQASFAAYPNLNKIRAHTDVENVASTRVLAKLGFTREGVLRSNQFVKGQLRDEAVYGLLRSECTF
jgi:RimJ/RimL family protein N-acetyltransferase